MAAAEEKEGGKGVEGMEKVGEGAGCLKEQKYQIAKSDESMSPANFDSSNEILE